METMMENKSDWNTWSEFKKTRLTLYEQVESELKTQLYGEIMKPGEKKTMTQEELGKLAGVHRTAISKLINGDTDPRLSTILKILAIMGKGLKIAPIEEIID